MARTLDKIHTRLSYIEGSLKNATIINSNDKQQGFIFSLLNPPVPLGGNVISLDIFVDEIPISKKSIHIATSDDVVNASTLSEQRPLTFKPFQSARFLIVSEHILEAKKKHKVIILSKLEGFEQIIIPFTFYDYVGEGTEHIIIPKDTGGDLEPDESSEHTLFKNFTTPLILSGKKAYIVCSSNASISANWSWMGARYDNGGLYVPPARAFGRIIVEVSADDGVRKRLPNFVVSSRHENGILYTRHEVSGLQVKRTLSVPTDHKGLIMKLEISDRDSHFQDLNVSTRKIGKMQRKIRLHFLIDSNITSYGLAAISQSNFSKMIKTDNCIQIQTAAKNGLAHYYGTIGVSPKTQRPYKVLMDSFDNDLELSYNVQIQSNKASEIALVAAGSFSSPEDCLQEYRFLRDNYNYLLEDTKAHFESMASSTLRITTTADTIQSSTMIKLLRAFEKAKTSLEYLKAEYDELGVGICAGLPRFPNYWARDTGWSLRGYLAIGDYQFVLPVIHNFLSHQAKKSSKYATKGELPMIISGKSFLHSTTYGSADSTFLFPWAIREYVLSTGNINFLKNRWQDIIDLINYGFSKDIDNDGLIENGFTGLAEKLPIQDSTWMDHIDRRKSANDIQALFYESLKIGVELAELVGDRYNGKRWLRESINLKNKIELEYWNEDSKFYFDTIRKDGSKDSSLRPNALVLLLTDAVSSETRAQSVLARLEREDMSTPWGVRTLSAFDPKYHPTLYHDGAVWPLVTGWMAICESKFNRTNEALYYLESMADRILSENGMYAETYRGDRPEPFNSCILQAWSVGTYVHAIREMILGMKINLIENKICFEPKIPDSLKNNCMPLKLEYNLNSVENNEKRDRMLITLDPVHDQILVNFKDRIDNKLPHVYSNSYSVKIE